MITDRSTPALPASQHHAHPPHSATDRRGEDRRKGEDPNYKGPERRTGGNRRSEAVPVLEFQRAPPERKRRTWKWLVLVNLLGLVGALVPAILIFGLLKNTSPLRPSARDTGPALGPDPFAAMRTEVSRPGPGPGARSQAPEPAPRDPGQVPLEVRLTEGLLNIAPRIYESVHLDLEQTMWASNSQPNVKAIDIRVRSVSWDLLQSEERVSLVNSTFAFLREKYPQVTPNVHLNFDDERHVLDLRYQEPATLPSSGSGASNVTP